MSIFPTKILLATDGSSEAELATRTAVDLAQKTGSELHVVYVLDVVQIGMLEAEAIDPEGVEQLDPILEEALERLSEQRGKEVLDTEVERIRSAGGTVAQTHLMVVGVAVYRSHSASKAYALALGAAYAGLFLLGILSGSVATLGGLLPLNGLDNLLHIATSLIAFGAYVASRDREPADARRAEGAS